MSSSAVKQVVATGFIIYRRLQGEIQFLMLQASNSKTLWGPPKGRVDPGETEFETALRETEEEAGLKREHLNIMQDFEKTLHYTAYGKPKRTVYWLAELIDPNTPIILSHEHTSFKWLDHESAKAYGKFPDMQSAIADAYDFISNQN